MRRVIALIVIAASFFFVYAPAATAGVNVWTTNGPGNSNSAVGLSPNFGSDHTVFAWSNGSGVFKSTDDGYHWNPVNIGNTSTVVYQFAFSPDYQSDNTMFICASSGIYKSTDQGSNWRQVATYSYVSGIVISPAVASDKTMFAFSGIGAFLKSTDSGESWSQVGYVGSTQYMSLAISPDFANDRTLYIGTVGKGVIRSTDGGNSWNSINNGLSTTGVNVYSIVLSPAFASDHKLFAGTGNFTSGGTGSIYVSTDGGNSWTASVAGLSNNNVHALALSPEFTSDGVMFAGTYLGGVFESTDGGSNWSSLNNGLTNATVYGLAASPVLGNNRSIYAGTNSGVYNYISDPVGNCSTPSLNLSRNAAYWASFPDYEAHILSIDLSITNAGSDSAFAMAITGAAATNGVSSEQNMPLYQGILSAGSSHPLILTYSVPSGVNFFNVSVSASAEDACDTSYSYP